MSIKFCVQRRGFAPIAYIYIYTEPLYFRQLTLVGKLPELKYPIKISEKGNQKQ